MAESSSKSHSKKITSQSNEESKQGEHKTSCKSAHNMSEIDRHIAQKFDIRKRLGKGAYGIVWKAVDRKTNQVVAVKKIFDAFRNQTDAQRTFREIVFLQSFRNHPNIIKLYGVYKAENNRDIYLGFEYMNTDLHNVIKRGNILKDVHKRYIMYQLLKATKYIHSGNVIHRDQKPSNVLIDSTCRVKIADFGLARSLSSLSGAGEGGRDPCLTDYVATRWYRAPEILIASKNYTKGIDMWSLGCILGEMITGKPLFPGSSTVNQVERIMACIPPPSEEDINEVCTGYGSALVRQCVRRVVGLSSVLQAGPQDAQELAQRLLVFNPAHRATAHQALQHPYVSKFHQERNEPVLSGDVIPPLCDDLRLSVDEYRNRLYGIIKGNSRISASAGSESAPLDHKTAGAPPPSRAARTSSHPHLPKPDKHHPSLSHIISQYAHTKLSSIQPHISNTSNKPPHTSEKIYKHKPSESRNPLRKNYSLDECNNSQPKGKVVRSMSEDSYSKSLVKVKRNGSFSGASATTNTSCDGTAFSKFSQKYGVVTVSALMDIRANIR